MKENEVARWVFQEARHCTRRRVARQAIGSSCGCLGYFFGSGWGRWDSNSLFHVWGMRPAFLNRFSTWLIVTMVPKHYCTVDNLHLLAIAVRCRCTRSSRSIVALIRRTWSSYLIVDRRTRSYLVIARHLSRCWGWLCRLLLVEWTNS
jgi:hypothetical protein